MDLCLNCLHERVKSEHLELVWVGTRPDKCTSCGAESLLITVLPRYRFFPDDITNDSVFEAMRSFVLHNYGNNTMIQPDSLVKVGKFTYCASISIGHCPCSTGKTDTVHEVGSVTMRIYGTPRRQILRNYDIKHNQLAEDEAKQVQEAPRS